MSDKEKFEEIIRIHKEIIKILKESKIKELSEVKEKIAELETVIVLSRAYLLQIEDEEKENKDNEDNDKSTNEK